MEFCRRMHWQIPLCTDIKHATYYRFSNIVLNLSNLAIWFFLVQISFSILSIYLRWHRYARKSTLNSHFYFYLLVFLNKHNVWHTFGKSQWNKFMNIIFLSYIKTTHFCLHFFFGTLITYAVQVKLNSKYLQEDINW